MVKGVWSLSRATGRWGGVQAKASGAPPGFLYKAFFRSLGVLRPPEPAPPMLSCLRESCHQSLHCRLDQKISGVIFFFLPALGVVISNLRNGRFQGGPQRSASSKPTAHGPKQRTWGQAARLKAL
jgi:hypothetical protein